VNDGVVPGDGGGNGVGIAQVADDEAGAGGYGVAAADGQVVEDGDGVAGGDELGGDAAADEAGAAGDYEFNGCAPGVRLWYDIIRFDVGNEGLDGVERAA
jgi:hypothetical protein